MKRSIYIIETPPTDKEFKQVAAMLSGLELAQAKKERPDLIFRAPSLDEVKSLEQEENVIEQEPEQEELPPELAIYSKPMSLHGLRNTKIDKGD